MDVVDKIQEVLYTALTEEGYDVFDVPELDTPFPFVKMGDASVVIQRDKTEVTGFDVRQEIHIWNSQGDKQFSNEMVNNVMYTLLQLEIDGLNVISQDVDAVGYTDYENARQSSMTLDLKIDI